MVFIHLKKNDQSVLLAQFPVNTSTDTLISNLVQLCNERLRVERLCSAIDDLIKFGIYKPFEEHGYQPDDLDKFIHNNNNNNQQEQDEGYSTGTIVIHNGHECINNPDPTGRRNGYAPIPAVTNTIHNTLQEVLQSIHKNQVLAKVVLTMDKLNEFINILRGCVNIAYPMGLPDYDPVMEILNNTEDISICVHAKDILDPTTATLWWAGKELIRGKSFSDYVGRNDKTTIIAKLQKPNSGPPTREPPLSEQAQKDMLAYYYRKQEELKKLEDDDDPSYLQSHWANPNALKTSFQGFSKGVSWRPR